MNVHMTSRSGQPKLDVPRPRLDAISWMIILVLLSLMVATDFVAYLGWTLASGVEVTTAAYVAMAAGVLFSLVIGGGLMTLVFYSARSGYDEPPVFTGPDTDSKRAPSERRCRSDRAIASGEQAFASAKHS